MANISKRNRSKEREMETARKNRLEIIAAGLSRRDMIKMGLLTSAGVLIPKRGLSARALNSAGVPTGWLPSPPVTPFVEPLFIPPIAQPVPSLTPAPTVAPNTAAGERRTRDHQDFTTHPPVKFYEVHQRQEFLSVHQDFPLQCLWTFNGTVPGQTYVANYGEPILVRNFNDLPDPPSCGGFGKNSVTTHLHNGHTPSESDGFPCDFFERTFWYDQHYPNVLAGFSTPPFAPTGDIRESMSTLWYHDHRVDFTAQNVYKGLAGFYLLFNQFDTGNETTGFRLPTFPDFDIPMMFNDKNFDSDEELFFDLANRDGILGDRFLVNGKIQPFLQVKPRRYRFRWLNGGPSRFYQFYITKTSDNSNKTFHVISNDGNLLRNPVLATNGLRISVAERMDVIVDFTGVAPGTHFWLENRLIQTNGANPSNNLKAQGQGDKVLRFEVVSGAVNDQSVNPADNPTFYEVPPRENPFAERSFRFHPRSGGQWAIDGQLFDCNDVRFRVKRNTAEEWRLNGGFNWQHPIHIHFEEFQIINRNGSTPPPVERGRKDVLRLGTSESVLLFFRFRDFVGRFPMHCHNTIHEDHAMMLRWDIDDEGDGGDGDHR